MGKAWIFMNSQMKQVCQNVMRGTELEINLPRFFNYFTSTYYTYAKTMLSLNFETILDDETDADEEQKELIKPVCHLLQDVIFSSGKMELLQAVEEIDELRCHTEKRMEVLLYYADVMSIYEYVMNRVEYKYTKSQISLKEDEDFAREILQYIFEENDNVIVNDRIKEMLQQLPIRLTKSKYFELLSQSMDAYKEADASTFDSYLYMLRSGATIYQPEQIKEFYPEFQKEVKWVKKIDFNDLSEDSFLKTQQRLQKVMKSIEKKTEWLYDYQNIVNELYAMLVCKQYEGLEQHDFVTANEDSGSILKSLISFATGEQKTEEKDRILDESYEKLEGIQEEMLDDVALLDSVLEKIGQSDLNKVKELMLEPMYSSASLASKLLSNSLFVKLTQEEEVSMTETSFAEKKEMLLSEMKTLFENGSSRFNRAVMAYTLGRMPVFFTNHKEVMDYVINAIVGCNDVAEKYAFTEIINDILENA